MTDIILGNLDLAKSELTKVELSKLKLANTELTNFNPNIINLIKNGLEVIINSSGWYNIIQVDEINIELPDSVYFTKGQTLKLSYAEDGKIKVLLTPLQINSDPALNSSSIYKPRIDLILNLSIPIENQPKSSLDSKVLEYVKSNNEIFDIILIPKRPSTTISDFVAKIEDIVTNKKDLNPLGNLLDDFSNYLKIVDRLNLKIEPDALELVKKSLNNLINIQPEKLTDLTEVLESLDTHLEIEKVISVIETINKNLFQLDPISETFKESQIFSPEELNDYFKDPLLVASNKKRLVAIQNPEDEQTSLKADIKTSNLKNFKSILEIFKLDEQLLSHNNQENSIIPKFQFTFFNWRDDLLFFLPIIIGKRLKTVLGSLNNKGFTNSVSQAEIADIVFEVDLPNLGFINCQIFINKKLIRLAVAQKKSADFLLTKLAERTEKIKLNYQLEIGWVPKENYRTKKV